MRSTRWFHNRFNFVLFSACAAVVVCPVPGRADERASLRGITGFYVSTVENIGLTADRAQKSTPESVKKLEDDAGAGVKQAVEAELRKAGIDVLTEDDFQTRPDVPSLQLSEMTLLDGFGTRHTAVSLEVRQLVTIYTNQHVDLATTWSRDRLVVVGSKTPRGTEDVVHALVVELIADYVKANPKTSADTSHD